MSYGFSFIFSVIARKPKATRQSIFLESVKFRVMYLIYSIFQKKFNQLFSAYGLPRRKLLAMTCSVVHVCFCLSFVSPAIANNSYQQMQKITANAMQANGNRMKNEAENMAGSKVPGYIPKRLPITVKRDRKAGVDRVVTKKAVRDNARTKVVYDPYHPQADAQGMVTFPDVDPMVSLMNLQETKADNERAMKAYQMATDQRHRILSMINQ